MERNMRVVVRAFNKEGYHRDILIASERQVHMTDAKLTDATASLMTGLIGHGARIDPRDFPEMEFFEVVVKSE